MQINENLIRRLKFLMLTLAMTALSMPFSVRAQEALIKLPVRELSARELFDEIQEQTQYKIAVNKSRFPDNLSLRVSKSSVTVAEAIQKLLADSGQTYVFEGDHIIIMEDKHPKKEPEVTARNVAGVVTDKSGKPLGGVAVNILNQRKASAKTSADGSFKISNVAVGRQVAEITPTDGGEPQRVEFMVQANKDANVKFTIEVAEKKPAPIPVEEPKTESYFVPEKVDNTVRASSNASKSEYSFIPTSVVDDNYRPKAAIKTNLLPWIATTPNISLEFGIAPKWTLNISTGYNPFQWQEGGVNQVGYVQPEFRYWFCDRFQRHFIGVHGHYGRFNIGDVNIPFTNAFDTHRYDGWAAGAGISYGYHLPMGKRWGWEFTIGAGYAYMEYDKYRCYDCDEYLGRKGKHYFGPTKAGVSLIFMIR